ncbi:MAG TPA: fatty acid desaturase [Solimonas sp.]|nr:fatty acid desaturase [Solimonas sp.]
MVPSTAGAGMNDAQKSAHIRQVVLQAGVELRQRHPWLKQQDLIGGSVMAVSILGMIASGWLYAIGQIPWWVCVPVSALFASFIHELEHDLIHTMYFRHSPHGWNLMMALCWITRPSTISPWVRKRIHLHHHKHSGTESDLEEFAVTNGERWGLKRLIMTGDHMLAIYLRPLSMHRVSRNYLRAQAKSREEFQALRRELVSGYFPLGLLHYALWHGFVAYHVLALGAAALGQPLPLAAWSQQASQWLGFGVDLPQLLALWTTVVVVWLAPNVLRVFSLHFIATNMHYYGDVEDGNVMQQCQVLNPWWLMPLQLFCFNFGATHAIHHFAVKEPFYVRQWTASTAHAVMREMGVRFNDIGTFRRANRWAKTDQANAQWAFAPSSARPGMAGPGAD